MITDSGTRCRELCAPADEVLQAAGGSDARATNRPAEGGDGFDRSRGQLEQIVEQLATVEADELEHGELECLIEREGRELLRQLLQDRLDLRALRESRLDAVVDAREVPRSAVECDHHRQLSSMFGEVTVGRLAYRARGEENLYVADGVLNLPAEHASHGVRRLAARAAVVGSFEDATGQVRERTGLDLGKRQVEELAVRAVVDFDAFYAERVIEAEQDRERGEDEVLVLSCDGKGIVMRAEALREATARAAKRASPKLKTRLSKGEKSGRKRIAEVGAVYEIEPAPHTPAEVLAPIKDKTLKPPRAKHKWVTASVVDDAASVVCDIFDEAERRDGDHRHRWVALVDGNNHHCDTRSHATSERRKIGGSADVESVIPGPYSMACPHPDVRRRFRPVGFGARGKAQGRPFHPGVTGEGKPGRVKNLNLRLMPRHVDPRWWDAGTGCKDWPLGSGRCRLGMVPSRDEYRRPRGTGGTHPGRISCAWNVVTPVGVRCCLAGKPTARKAQSPGGNLMIEKRMPAVERQQETGT